MKDHTYRTRGRFSVKRSDRSPHWKGWVCAVIALSAWPGSGVTQVVRPDVPSSPVYFEFQVDEPATMVGSLAVTYPEVLRSAGVEGKVRFQFVVDAAGRVEQGTLRAVTSSNESFTSAGQAALLRAQFSPARIRNQPVRQLVELPMMFQVSR